MTLPKPDVILVGRDGSSRAMVSPPKTTIERIAEFAGVTLNGHSPLVSAMSRNQLPALFASLGYRRGAEIGVWEGEFSETLARGIPGLERLLCVDPWFAYRHYEERKNNQARMERAYSITKTRLQDLPCELIRMMSTEAARTIPDRSLDFAYIDSNHAEPFVSQDLAAWEPKVRVGGCLCGHDYLQSNKKRKQHKWIEVKGAVDKYTDEHKITPLFILTADKSPSFLWVVR